jgi:hypothetical protein
MNDNRYAPPTAKLADHESETELERPRVVVRAVQLLWTTFTLSVVATLVAALVMPAGVSAGVTVVSTTVNLLVQLGLAWWFNGAAWKGRGWSRWVQAVLGILALGFLYYAKQSVPNAFVLPWYLDAMSTLATLCNAVGVGLLFAPAANTWYRAMKAERARGG